MDKGAALRSLSRRGSGVRIPSSAFSKKQLSSETLLSLGPINKLGVRDGRKDESNGERRDFRCRRNG